MNQEEVIKGGSDCSSIQMDICVEESWICRYTHEENVVIPLNEQYQLSNLSFALQPGKLTLRGEIIEKPGSVLEMTCIPRWDSTLQQIQLEDLQIKTQSKNLLVKSAGWFAQTFMQNKIDSRVEQATNQLYRHYLDLIRTQALEIPFPKGGTARIRVSGVVIHEMTFLEKALDIKATVEGHWELHLMDDAIRPGQI